jgi:DNA-binding NarL/FixJ family response regulator
MTDLTGLTVNAATGEEVIAPLNQDELEYIQTITQEVESEKEAKATARTSALAKLAALGLTEEEIAAL